MSVSKYRMYLERENKDNDCPANIVHYMLSAASLLCQIGRGRIHQIRVSTSTKYITMFSPERVEPLYGVAHNVKGPPYKLLISLS